MDCRLKFLLMGLVLFVCFYQIIEEYKLDNTDGYFRHQEEICKINELTDDCIALGLDQYCLESSPNIPYESFLSCLSSFYTPELNK